MKSIKIEVLEPEFNATADFLTLNQDIGLVLDNGVPVSIGDRTQLVPPLSPARIERRVDVDQVDAALRQLLKQLEVVSVDHPAAEPFA